MPRLADQPLSPLEQFLCDYTEARDGAWDEIEPRVYDLLIGPDLIRATFDPEALPEHPNAQLASLGSPLLDQLLADAVNRWSSARFYRIGLNLYPHDLPLRLCRALTLPPNVSATLQRARTMICPQAVFWFKATFTADQKEEEILPLGIDLHQLRQVRHLELLLKPDTLSDLPELNLPEAPHAGLMSAFRHARREIAPTVASLANARRREWTGRVEKQIRRMSAYYAQLRAESDQQSARAAHADAASHAASRRQAIDREERLRIAELRQKSEIRVALSLATLMVVQQPKILLSVAIAERDRPLNPIEVTWDPLSETIEAPACPACRQPTFALRIYRSTIGCPHCRVPGPA